MVPGTECHLRVNDYFVFKLRARFMKSGSNVYLFAKNYRLKVTFPYLVPVLLRNKRHLITKRKHIAINAQSFIQYFLAKIIHRNVGLKAKFQFLKSIETNIAQSVYQQILLVIFGCYGGKKQFVVIHSLLLAFDFRFLI